MKEEEEQQHSKIDLGIKTLQDANLEESTFLYLKKILEKEKEKIQKNSLQKNFQSLEIEITKESSTSLDFGTRNLKNKKTSKRRSRSTDKLEAITFEESDPQPLQRKSSLREGISLKLEEIKRSFSFNKKEENLEHSSSTGTKSPTSTKSPVSVRSGGSVAKSPRSPTISQRVKSISHSPVMGRIRRTLSNGDENFGKLISFATNKIEGIVNEDIHEDLSEKKVTEYVEFNEHYFSLQEIQKNLQDSGLEKIKLMFAIDYTFSNQMKGKKSFGGQSLHFLSNEFKNPYQNVIEMIGKTLDPFQEDKQISMLGFGDQVSKGDSCFDLVPESLCVGYVEALEIYQKTTQHVKLQGPTNFAPVINVAIEFVKESKEFTLLVIITDSDVIQSKKNETCEAISKAASLPLSILVVGVGDGGWGDLPTYNEINEQFHFVEFYESITKSRNQYKSFTLNAFEKIQLQMQASKNF
jgi:E3 ubiquitin-protein ligase RGLG